MFYPLCPSFNIDNFSFEKVLLRVQWLYTRRTLCATVALDAAVKKAASTITMRMNQVGNVPRMLAYIGTSQ
jgi:hypothetical protein